jgi:hypothetical protein
MSRCTYFWSTFADGDAVDADANGDAGNTIAAADGNY